jgi:hypothetical protein
MMRSKPKPVVVASKRECASCGRGCYSGNGSCRFDLSQCSLPKYKHWVKPGYMDEK